MLAPAVDGFGGTKESSDAPDLDLLYPKFLEQNSVNMSV